LQNTLANSESHPELINFEILVGMMLLRPRPPTIKVEIPDAKNIISLNEAGTEEQYFLPKVQRRI